MKKIVLMLFLITSIILASTATTEEVKKEEIKSEKVNVENTWNTLNKILTININDTNESDIKESDINSNINLYNKLAKHIRLSNNLNETDFYDKEKGYKRKLYLRKKIKANQTHNNHLAILRDEIEIEVLDLKYKILNGIVFLTYDFKNKKDISKRLESIKKDLIKTDAKIDLFKEKLKENEQESKVFIKAEENLNTLKLITKNYQELNNYFLENKNSILKKETFLEILKVEEIITKTNNIKEIKQINYYLSEINTDFPRLILSILLLFIFWILNRILYHKLLPLLQYNIDKIEKEEVDIFLKDFERLKRPITYIVMLFGLEISLKVLLYPHQLNSIISGGISIAYILFFIMIIVTLVNIIFSTIIQTNKAENKKELLFHGRKLVKILVVIGGGLYALDSVGYNISAFLASLGLMGMAVALAAKDTIANLFGSMVILSDRPFRIGDWVTLGDGTDGTIEEIGIRSTKVRTFSRSITSVPNAKLANGTIENWSKMDKRRIKHRLGLTYDTSSEQMENILSDIRTMLDEDENIHDGAYIHFEGFGPSELIIFCYYFTKTTNWDEFMQVRGDTNLKIMKIIENNKAQFAFPTQTIHYKKETYEGA